nr:MAG TPA: hypothetical protein [Caudoviricetes sp.]
MKKKVKDLKPGEIFAMALPTGLTDVPTLVVAMVKHFDGDIQVIPQHIHPETLANLEINCHGHSPMFHTSCEMFDTGLMDIWEGYVEYV